MSALRLIRLSGIALFVTSIIAVLVSFIGTIAFPVTGFVVPAGEINNPLWVPLWSISFVGTALMVLGLPAFYQHQASRVGVIGLVSFLLAMIGNLLTMAIAFFFIVVMPFLAEKAPETLNDTMTPGVVVFGMWGGASLCVGLILLGIVTIRARVFPRLVGVFLLIGGLLSPGTLGVNLFVTLIGMLSTFLVSLSFGWAGYLLITLSKPTAIIISESLELNSTK